jgi:hypothetical protein
MKEKKKISYTAIVLDEKSREKLMGIVEPPESWDILCHHMTINLGEAKPEFARMVGKQVSIVIESAAIDFGIGVMAVGVNTDIPSKNDVKHITVAVNRSIGAKPKDSNKLTSWVPMTPMVLSGKITEVPF